MRSWILGSPAAPGLTSRCACPHLHICTPFLLLSPNPQGGTPQIPPKLLHPKSPRPCKPGHWKNPPGTQNFHSQSEIWQWKSSPCQLRMFGFSFSTKNVIYLTEVAHREGLELTAPPPQQLLQGEQRQLWSSQASQCPIPHFQSRKFHRKDGILPVLFHLNELSDCSGRKTGDISSWKPNTAILSKYGLGLGGSWDHPLLFQSFASLGEQFQMGKFPFVPCLVQPSHVPGTFVCARAAKEPPEFFLPCLRSAPGVPILLQKHHVTASGKAEGNPWELLIICPVQ